MKFSRHRIGQINYRHGVVAAPVVAGDGVKVFGACHIAGFVRSFAQFYQQQWAKVLQVMDRQGETVLRSGSEQGTLEVGAHKAMKAPPAD